MQPIRKKLTLRNITEINTRYSGKNMAPRYEFTFSKSFRVDKGVKDTFEDEGFIILRSLWSGAEVQKLLRFFETSPAIERNSYREAIAIGRGRVLLPRCSSIMIYFRVPSRKFALQHRCPIKIKGSNQIRSGTRGRHDHE